MVIEAVLFDYSGVLTTGFTFPTENVPYDPDLLFAEMVKALSGDQAHPWHQLERGEISLGAYIEFVESVVPGGGALFDVASPLNVMAGLELLDARLAVAADLRAMGLRVGLVTNNVAEWEPLWRPGLPDGIFEVIVDSAAVGCRKPDAEIYERALRDLGVSPEKALIIDDFEWNVRGAEAVGMTGIHCTGALDLHAAVQSAVDSHGSPDSQ